MKTNYILLLFIAGCILFSSFGQTVNHDKEIEYYITLVTETKNTAIIINNFWHETVEAAIIALQNQDMKLDSSYINTLLKRYQITNLAIDTSIEKLSTLVEIDQSINLKERTITHLKDIKALQESALTNVIKGLSTGIETTTNEERESFMKFQLRVDELRTASADLEKLALDFRDKHKITYEELKKYGL